MDQAKCGSGRQFDFMSSQVIVFEFSHREVLQRDYGRFLARFGFHALPEGQELQSLRGGMVFCVAGFDADARELYEIPEVREFFFGFHQAWPFALYFCALQHDCLRLMTLCRLASVASVKTDGSDQVRVNYDVTELLRIFPVDLFAMNLVCERARLSEQEIFEQTQAIFEYWGLPFHTSSV
jgi:hypothetical protein